MRYLECNHIQIDGSDTLFDWRRIPPATKFLTVGYISLTSSLFVVKILAYRKSRDPQLQLENIVSPIVQLIPSKVLFYPLSLVLSNLVDVKFWRLILDLPNLIVGGSFIERSWGSGEEMLKFVLFIGSLTNLVITMTAIILNFITPRIPLDRPLDENYNFLIGFAIIYKQLMPEITILKLKNMGALSKTFRFKHLPTFMMCYLTIMFVIFGHITQVLSIWVTFFFCWFYLRFYQVSRTGERSTVGDASDSFQLLFFFPYLARPFLKPVFNSAYFLFCTRLQLVQPFHLEDIDRSNTLTEQRGSNINAVSAEERRKQLALQVLQERIV